jgi:hypothetical protein
MAPFPPLHGTFLGEKRFSLLRAVNGFGIFRRVLQKEKTGTYGERE